VKAQSKSQSKSQTKSQSKMRSASGDASSKGSAAPAAAAGASLDTVQPVSIHAPVDPAILRKRCDPTTLGFATTDELEDSPEAFGQARALEAIRFGVAMDQPGYNTFALGPSGVGKHALVRGYLTECAANRPVPLDWVYVHDFGKPHEPRALSLPAGIGRKLVADAARLVEELRAAIPAAFETREYATRIQEVQKEFQAKHEALFAEIEATGAARGVAVLRSPAGVVFAPVQNGEVLAPAEFEKLPDAEKERLRQTVHDLEKELTERVKELPRIHTELRQRVRDLDRDVTRYAVDNAVEPFLRDYAEHARVVQHLNELSADVVEHAADFRKDKDEDGALPFGLHAERRFDRYSVNLFVDNSSTQGAPVVYDDRASYDHLIGRVEHVAELGNLVTNFNLLKSGSLHRANGGYLLLDARKVLSQPYAWEGLKQTLFARRVQMETLTQLMGLSSTESLRPEPIPLDVKVVLFGTRDIYYLLCEHDPEFLDLFKVEADFEDVVGRSPETERAFARTIATIARQRSLLPFDVSAVASLIDESARLAGDSRKLSTSIRSLFDLAAEAEHYAKLRAASIATAVDVAQARDAQSRQRDRLRQGLLEAVVRKTILIDVSGRRVGQVNGLAAIALGDFTFGRPTRITATARIGDGRVIDIEREVELGGPLHSKGVLILTNYLAERYAKRYPLSLSASLVFEQSYSGVEGDSASLAELCALLSSLSGVPVKQSIALTGSVNQWGQVQAIGAVNEKVEGFYDTCRALGLDGGQGVIVPRANLEHLMLREDVAEAARRGEIHLYVVDTVDEAMEILTDLPSGVPNEEGECPEGTLGHLVEQQLVEFAVVAKRFGEFVEVQGEPEGPRKKKKSRGKRKAGGGFGRKRAGR
jgi:lon-related putative ATP-dependent protease